LVKGRYEGRKEDNGGWRRMNEDTAGERRTRRIKEKEDKEETKERGMLDFQLNRRAGKRNEGNEYSAGLTRIQCIRLFYKCRNFGWENRNYLREGKNILSKIPQVLLLMISTIIMVPVFIFEKYIFFKIF
jgi:hypothetical protein